MEIDYFHQMSALIYVCSECGNLAYADKDTFEESEADAIHAGSYSGTIDTYNGNSDNKYEGFTMPKLCSKCIELHIKALETQSMMIVKFIENVGRIEKLEKEYKTEFNDNIITETSHVEKKSVQLPEIPKPNRSHNVPEIICPKMSPTYSRYLAFNISYSGPFGTINQLRIGSLKSMPVPVEEVQYGLYLLCRYLLFYTDLLKLEKIEISYQKHLILKSEKTEHSLVYKDKNTNMREFNNSLNFLYSSFDKIFTVLSTRGISPPHQILTAKQTISGYPYHLSSNPFDFTHGMKKLLVNLKTVQMLETFL